MHIYTHTGSVLFSSKCTWGKRRGQGSLIQVWINFKSLFEYKTTHTHRLTHTYTYEHIYAHVYIYTYTQTAYQFHQNGLGTKKRGHVSHQTVYIWYMCVHKCNFVLNAKHTVSHTHAHTYICTYMCICIYTNKQGACYFHQNGRWKKEGQDPH